MTPLHQTGPSLVDREALPSAGDRGMPSADPRTWHKPLLIGHILASVGVVGADLALLMLGLIGALGADGRSIYPAAYLVASRVIVPLATLSLGTGVLLGILTPHGLFKHGWVIAKFAITVALFTAVVFVLKPGLEYAAAVVGAGGSLSVAQRLRYLVGPAVACVLLVFNVVLAVYKPRRHGP